MLNIRKAIKQFKTDFIAEPDAVPSTSSSRSDTSSPRTTSDNASRYTVSLTRSLQNTVNRDEAPVILVEPADSSNFNEAVSPLRKRSLFQRLQRNTSLVSPNVLFPSIDGPSHQYQSKSNLTPILGIPIPVNPMNDEFSRIAPSSSSEMRTGSLGDSSVPSIEILSPATHSKQVLSESLQQHSSMTRIIPHDPRRKESESDSPLSSADYDTANEFGQPELGQRPKSLVDFSMPSNVSSSKATDGSAVSSTPLMRKIPESLSNSTTLSNSEADNIRPMESKQSPVTQTSQQSRESHFPLDEPSTSSSVPDSNLTSSKDNNADNRAEARRKPSSTNLNPFLLALAAPRATPTVVSAEVPETVEQTKTPWRPRPSRMSQSIGESGDSMSANSPSALFPDDVLACKLEESGRIRRMELHNQLTQFKASHEATSHEPSQPIRTTATPKAELQPHMHQEDSSSDVIGLLEAAYIERQQALQTQVDEVLAELRDVRKENKRLTNENHSQPDSILQLKIALYEAKHVQDQSFVRIENQLRDALTSLTALNKEKKRWQDKLDSMQHKLGVAERRVRCLDHLTRHKLELRQEAAYGHPRRGGLSASVLASTEVIGAMGALNEEISQTCVQLVGSLRRMNLHSNRHKLQAQKVLGDRLTVMMENQATISPSDYNTPLMQAVLEVFMVHWCSSIIQAFYPKQESFADLLVQLSARTAKTPESSAICGKQIRIVQPSTLHTNKVKFKEWVTDIIQELDSLLLVAGVRTKTLRVNLFYTKILALIKVAYGLRMAMAEQDIHGDLEVVIVAPDTPLQEKWMLDAHADTRKGDMDQSYVDIVAGTSGIGLQRKVLERAHGYFQSRVDMPLKPKVILAQALDVKIKSSK